MKKLFLCLSLMILTLSGCTTATTTTREEDTATANEELQSKVGIALENSTLRDPYIITVNSEGTRVQEYLDGTYKVNVNDIIVVFAEEGDYYNVVLAYGDLPYTRGKIKKDSISFDSELFANANQAQIDNASCYDDIDGNEICVESGTGQIEQREDGWISLSLPGYGEAMWVKAEDLSYEWANVDAAMEIVGDDWEIVEPGEIIIYCSHEDEVEGRLAIVTANTATTTTLNNCYAFTYDEDEDEYVRQEIGDYELSVNDLLVVYGEGEDYYDVILPYGDVRVRGEIAKEAVSFDEALFANANQASIEDAAYYDVKDGRVWGTISGMGMVIAREDGWACIELYDYYRSVWVREEDLSYDFYTYVLIVD